jgi:hypothetical protein
MIAAGMAIHLCEWNTFLAIEADGQVKGVYVYTKSQESSSRSARQGVHARFDTCIWATVQVHDISDILHIFSVLWVAIQVHITAAFLNLRAIVQVYTATAAIQVTLHVMSIFCAATWVYAPTTCAHISIIYVATEVATGTIAAHLHFCCIPPRASVMGLVRTVRFRVTIHGWCGFVKVMGFRMFREAVYA